MGLRKFIKGARLLRHPIYRRGLRYGVAAAIEHECVIRSLDIRSAIDIGANKGQFSLLLKRYFPSLKIVAFEPLHEAAGRYERLFSLVDNVTLHRVAVGEREGEAEIHVAARLDSSSLLPILPRQSEIFPGTGEVETRNVSVVTLDGMPDIRSLPAPCLIKIDVQGFELSVLKGMRRMLEQTKYLYLELSFMALYHDQALAKDIIEWLLSVKFKLSSIYNVVYDSRGLCVQADVLFMRESP